MSVTMQQGLGSLLIRKTEESRAKARRSMETCQDAINTVQHVEQMSVLVSLVKTNMERARSLLNEPSYLVCLRCMANLNMLHDVIQDLDKLASLYSNRVILQSRRNNIKRNQEQYDESKNTLEKFLLNISEQYDKSKKLLEKSMPNTSGRQPGEGLQSLMLIIGYIAAGAVLYYVAGGTSVGWDSLLSLLLWPIYVFVVMLAKLLTGAWDEVLLGLKILAVWITPLGIQMVFSKAIYNSREARREEIQRKIVKLTKDFNESATETQERLSATSSLSYLAEGELSSTKRGVDDIDREVLLHSDKITQQVTNLVW